VFFLEDSVTFWSNSGGFLAGNLKIRRPGVGELRYVDSGVSDMLHPVNIPYLDSCLRIGHSRPESEQISCKLNSFSLKINTRSTAHLQPGKPGRPVKNVPGTYQNANGIKYNSNTGERLSPSTAHGPSRSSF